MYDIMVLLRSKKMVEIQFQALLHAPARPKGKSPPKKREQIIHHCGRDPENHQKDVGSMLPNFPGRQFTAEK